MAYIRPDNWDVKFVPTEKNPIPGPYDKDKVPLPEELEEKASLPEGMNTNVVWDIDIPRIKSSLCPYRVYDNGMYLCERLISLKVVDDTRCLRKHCEFEVIKF